RKKLAVRIDGRSDRSVIENHRISLVELVRARGRVGPIQVRGRAPEIRGIGRGSLPYESRWVPICDHQVDFSGCALVQPELRARIVSVGQQTATAASESDDGVVAARQQRSVVGERD